MFLEIMAIKELIIQVKISEDGIATAMKKQGFTKDASGHFEVIGILQNLINLEQQKIEKVAYKKFDGN